MRTRQDWRQGRLAVVTGPRDAAFRAARTCYRHLAGQLGVALADAFVSRGHIVLTSDASFITDAGVVMFERLGIDVASLSTGSGKKARVLCRPCLDWSERRPHIAGALGAALCARSFEQNWVRRIDSSRAVVVTPRGLRIFCDMLGARFDG